MIMMFTRGVDQAMEGTTSSLLLNLLPLFYILLEFDDTSPNSNHQRFHDALCRINVFCFHLCRLGHGDIIEEKGISVPFRVEGLHMHG